MFYYGDNGALIVRWHDARVPHDFYIKNIFGKWNNEALTGRTLQACLIISQVTGQHFCCTDDEAVNFFWRNDDAGSISLGRAERASWFLQRKMRISSEDITRRQQLGRKPAGLTIPSEEAEAFFSRIKKIQRLQRDAASVQLYFFSTRRLCCLMKYWSNFYTEWHVLASNFFRKHTRDESFRDCSRKGQGFWRNEASEISEGCYQHASKSLQKRTAYFLTKSSSTCVPATLNLQQQTSPFLCNKKACFSDEIIKHVRFSPNCKEGPQHSLSKKPSASLFLQKKSHFFWRQNEARWLLPSASPPLHFFSMPHYLFR